jgi:hypothetical protein
MSRELSEPEILLRLLDGLKKASGSAGQLAHHQQNPAWLDIRNNLEIMHKLCSQVATSRAVPRQEVLRSIDRRAKTFVSH